MYKTLHKKQGSVTVQLRFARSSVTFCAKRDTNYSREVVEKHLRVINKARRCPDHSYTKNTERWEEKDFEKFRVSISWLEDILKDYF